MHIETLEQRRLLAAAVVDLPRAEWFGPHDLRVGLASAWRELDDDPQTSNLTGLPAVDRFELRRAADASLVDVLGTDTQIDWDDYQGEQMYVEAVLTGDQSGIDNFRWNVGGWNAFIYTDYDGSDGWTTFSREWISDEWDGLYGYIAHADIRIEGDMMLRSQEVSFTLHPEPAGDEWPDKDNTGPYDESALRPHAGTMTVTSAWTHGGSGTVSDPFIVEDWDIAGGLDIKASNVLVRNVRADGNGRTYVLNASFKNAAGQRYTNIVVEDSEFHDATGAIAWLFHTSVYRSEFYESASDGLKMRDSSRLYDSYIHHPLGTASGAHADGIQIEGGANIVVQGNNIDMPKYWSDEATTWENVPNTRSNAAMFINHWTGEAVTNLLVDGNRFSGGNYILYLKTSDGARVTDNVFKRYKTDGSGRNTYLYGVRQISGDVARNYVWTGNTHEDDGSEVPS